MRITIKHDTVQRGFILKTTYYQVSLTVLFSHEEKQILRQRNLLKTKLLDRRPATAKVDDRDSKFELLINHIINGQTDRFLAADPSSAKRYQDTLIETLEQLKLWISDNAELGDDFVVEL